MNTENEKPVLINIENLQVVVKRYNNSLVCLIDKSDEKMMLMYRLLYNRYLGSCDEIEIVEAKDYFLTEERAIKIAAW